MSDIAAAEPQTAIAVQQQAAKPPKPARETRISGRLRKAIDLIESGECATQKAAAVRAGLNEAYLSRALKKVEIQAFIAQRRSQNVAVAALRGSRRLVQLIDAESEHVSAKMVERVLETTGDLKSGSGPSVNVNISNNIAPGYVIDMAPWQPIDVTPAEPLPREER